MDLGTCAKFVGDLPQAAAPQTLVAPHDCRPGPANRQQQHHQRALKLHNAKEIRLPEDNEVCMPPTI